MTAITSTLKYGFVGTTEFLGRVVVGNIHSFGDFILFILEVLHQCVRPPYRLDLVFQQLEFIGNQSLNIILLTSFFTGAVFGLQIGGIFQIFSAEGMLGGATGKALARELAPLMTGFLLAGRAGSAMTAEIGTMRVNEQVDAMEAMGVDPVEYLIAPRVIASIIMIPLLCGIFMFVGVIGSYVTGVALFEVDQGVFIEKLTYLCEVKDIFAGLQKAVIFAVVIAALACRYGLNASGGAKGVGIATTDSVVIILLTVLAVDFIITYIQIALLE